MTATFSVFMPTMTRGFCQFSLPMLKGSVIHSKRRGDLLHRLHRSRLSKRAAAAPCVETGVTLPILDRPPLPHLFSAALKAFAWRWVLHGLTHAPGGLQGQTGSSAHNHNGRPHPIPIAFPLTGERGGGGDPVVHITVAEANLAEMEGEMEKGSPLTLIWANNTAPAPDEHPRRKKKKNGFQTTEPPCSSLTEDSELIKIINCTCHICNLFYLYLMRWNTCESKTCFR